MHDPVIYCFDTSAFIDPWRRFYLPSYPFCKPLWEHVEKLIDGGRIVLPEEVLAELKEGDDEVYAFVKRYPHAVVPVSEGQLDMVVKIFTTHSQLIDKQKTMKNHADALVIAAAKETGSTVVTFESGDKGFSIPAVCAAYEVPCMRFKDFIAAEKF